MSDRWRGILAVLLNPELRAVLADAISEPSLPPARRERAITRLVDLGLLRRDGDNVVFDDRIVREILAETARPRPTGPHRFLADTGRIDRYPVHAADREELLRWVASRAFAQGEVLTEIETNERLEAFADDVAALRRYLVDAGLLERTRSGSEYALADSPE
ncbi:DUF2087 domain-containing protein [Microbacterium sp. NPDC057407]|uniref:DUF2087 domain-containing protein n=1 Tax=Microbacterium sp. NPDC057407 TaxID=3346120 RepID=UPI003672848B